MRRIFLVALFVALFGGTIENARADFSLYISSETIPVGGSVTIDIAYAYAPISLSGLAYLQAQYPNAGYFAIGADDLAMQANASFSAPSSEQGSGTSYYMSVYGETIETPATFTYAKAGQYQIAYDYGISAFENIIAAVFNDQEEDVLISFGGQGGGTGSESGSGFISIQVGSVPETSTWAMFLIGLAGVGFAARRRDNRAAAIV